MGMVADKSDITPSGRASIGVKSISLAEGDYVVSAMQVSKEDNFLLFTESGTAKMMKFEEVPELVRNRKGFKVVKGDARILYVDLFNNNINYVTELSDKSLVMVQNKTIALGKRADEGKKLKHSNIVKIYRYVVE
jgi:DNA gyrase/topoisomerase IV subunit A